MSLTLEKNATMPTQLLVSICQRISKPVFAKVVSHRRIARLAHVTDGKDVECFSAPFLDLCIGPTIPLSFSPSSAMMVVQIASLSLVGHVGCQGPSNLSSVRYSSIMNHEVISMLSDLKGCQESRK